MRKKLFHCSVSIGLLKVLSKKHGTNLILVIDEYTCLLKRCRVGVVVRVQLKLVNVGI